MKRFGSVACLVVLGLGLENGCRQNLTAPRATAPAASEIAEIATISPSTGPVGATVEITGSGFPATGNVVKFGVGYVANLTSPDGRTLRFTIPEHHDMCPPAELGLTVPCAEAYPRVQPGEHPVSVVTRTRVSPQVVFTVTER
jgi:hypothetical protein